MTGPKAPMPLVVDVRSLPKAGHPVWHDASEAERAALARHNDLVSVESFVIDVTVDRWRADGARVVGDVAAKVVQPCALTLDPTPVDYAIKVDQTFVPEGSPLATSGSAEMMIDPDADDPPETFDGARIDVGALASELLTLAIDPYVRSEGAALGPEAVDEPVASPFAALAELSRKPDR